MLNFKVTIITYPKVNNRNNCVPYPGGRSVADIGVVGVAGVVGLVGDVGAGRGRARTAVCGCGSGLRQQNTLFLDLTIRRIIAA